MLAYGVATNALHECYHMGESTTMESLKKFLEVGQQVFEPSYLWQPIQVDLE
jgi:hypothetical protein